MKLTQPLLLMGLFKYFYRDEIMSLESFYSAMKMLSGILLILLTSAI